jgi:hypothetical protein
MKLFLAISAVLSAAVPICLRAAVESRRRAVEPAFSRALGVPVTVGDVEVGLTGTLHLRNVRVGTIASADEIEASIGLTSLLAGRLGADQIRVTRPRLSAPDPSALSALLRRVRDHRPAAAEGHGGGRVRRIVVDGGDLAIAFSAGQLHASGVELEPEAGGVRVVTGPATAQLAVGPFQVSASFARAGLDVSLPELTPTRAALDGGAITLASPGRPSLELRDAVLTRGVGAPGARLDAKLAGGQAISLRGARDAWQADVEDLPLAPLGAALPAWLGDEGTVSGSLSVARGGASVHITASGTADGIVVRHPLLAATAFPVSGALDADVTWDRDARAGTAHLHARTGKLSLDGDADLALDDAGRIARADAHVDVPTLPCADGLAALPAGLRAPLEGLDLDGTIGGGLAIGWDAANPDATTLDFGLDVGCRVLRELDGGGGEVAALAGPVAHTLPDGSPMTFAASDPRFVPLAALPDHVAAAFVSAEDGRFWDHHGFDAEQLRHSLAVDLAAGRVERGGSTISQQLVKNIFLTRDRTLARKLLEAVLTWRLEQRISKPRILELYVNVIQLGAKAYGIGDAARHWFGKDPRRLDVAEAALLAAITPAPTTIEHRIATTGRIDPETLKRAQIILWAMRRDGRISGDAYAIASQELPGLTVAVPRETASL